MALFIKILKKPLYKKLLYRGLIYIPLLEKLRGMVLLVEGNRYKLFGFNLLSDFTFPELTPSNNSNKLVDIEVLQTSEGLLNSGNYEFIGDRFNLTFHVPETATFNISNGQKITYTQLQGTDQGLMRLYLLGTCMGILLMQRQILPLHGSAVQKNGKVFAIVGHSGAGKSTLASVFLKKGYELLSDDIIAIKFDNQSRPIVIPSYPQQKLWENSLDQFGMNSVNYKPLYERETKYAIPVSNVFHEEALPLTGIYELGINECEKAVIEPIKGLEQFKTLVKHTYRHFLLSQMDLLDWHFKQSSKIINSVRMFSINRPSTGFTAYELAELIETTIIGGESNDVKSYSIIK